MSDPTLAPAATATDRSTPLGLIGGIGLTEVHVYNQRPAPDGRFSGCPHVHAVTDEGYYVLQGAGHVEFHDPHHGYRTLPLSPGDYVHFPPLVMHRLVSDGELVILGMMGNAGLAEAGEARIYFGREIDEDDERFAELVSRPRRLGLEGALQRRDAAVDAYLGLIDAWDHDRDAYYDELARFFDTHCRAMADHADAFSDKVEAGPLRWARATRQRIESLPDRPEDSADVKINRRGEESAYGMCGVLRPMLALRDAWQADSA